jgi:hypothetical protein
LLTNLIPPFCRDDNTTEGADPQASSSPRERRHINDFFDTPPNEFEPIQEIIYNNETIVYNTTLVNVNDPFWPKEFKTNGKINITGQYLLLTGLSHFTEYVISVSLSNNWWKIHKFLGGSLPGYWGG